MDFSAGVPSSFLFGEYQIRQYTVADAKALTEAAVSSYEHLRPWMSWANPGQTVEQSTEICRKIVENNAAGTDHTLGIWRGDQLVGSTGFHLRCGPVEWRCAEIGMWVRASHSGQGLGTSALQAMLQWGFTEWGWERLVWKCDTRNQASARVAEKCGLVLEGVLRSDALDVQGARRDTCLYAMIRPDWQRRAGA